MKVIKKPWGSETIIYEAAEKDPIVVKIIRTDGPLSIQLHPNKFEKFDLLDFDKSILPSPYICTHPGHTRDQVLRALNTDPSSWNKVILEPGVSTIVEPMTIHYIPGGLTLLEYSVGEQVTLRIRDYYGRASDLDSILSLVEHYNINY